jgi:hypothetical protein
MTSLNQVWNHIFTAFADEGRFSRPSHDNYESDAGRHACWTEAQDSRFVLQIVQQGDQRLRIFLLKRDVGEPCSVLHADITAETEGLSYRITTRFSDWYWVNRMVGRDDEDMPDTGPAEELIKLLEQFATIPPLRTGLDPEVERQLRDHLSGLLPVWRWWIISDLQNKRPWPLGKQEQRCAEVLEAPPATVLQALKEYFKRA